jgi:hypothetical protein
LAGVAIQRGQDTLNPIWVKKRALPTEYTKTEYTKKLDGGTIAPAVQYFYSILDMVHPRVMRNSA